MRYFTDGGPGPPTKMIRVDIGDANADNSFDAFLDAEGEIFSPEGWVKYPAAQVVILESGEFDRIPDDQVEANIDAIRKFWIDAPRLSRIARGLQ